MMDLFNHPITGLSRDGTKGSDWLVRRSAFASPGRGCSHQALQEEGREGGGVLMDRTRRGSASYRHDCMVPLRYHMPPWLTQHSCSERRKEEESSLTQSLQHTANILLYIKGILYLHPTNCTILDI